MPLPPAGKILWGASLQNELSFNWPAVLDNQLTYRRPGPGSSFLRNPAGVADAWITGRDYYMGADARWFDPTRWPALQDFIDWAQEGNAWRFNPDDRYPLYYVDSNYLEEPSADPRPGLERSGAEQAIAMLFRNRTWDFNLARRGLMFELTPSHDITALGGSFTRATVAYQQDRYGIFQQVASGVLRNGHYIGGYPHIVTEPAITNSALGSSLFADSTYWSDHAVFTITAMPSCVAGQTAYKLTPDGGTRWRSQTVGTFVNGQYDTFYAILEADTATITDLIFWDNTAAASVYLGRITWATKAFSTVSGTGTGGVVSLGTAPWGVALYMVWIRVVGTASGTGGNGNGRRVAIYPGGSSAATTGCIVHHAQLQTNSRAPGLPLVTVGASATKNADILNLPFSFVPQSLSLLSDGVAIGAANQADNDYSITTAVCIGAGNSLTHNVHNRLSAGVGSTRPPQLIHNINGGSQVLATTAGTVVYGTRVEMVSKCYSDGSIEAEASMDGGSIQSAGRSAALYWPLSFGVTRLDVGSFGQSGGGGWATRRIAVAPGVVSLSALRAA